MSEQQHFGMVAETIYMKREQMPAGTPPTNEPQSESDHKVGG